MSDNIIITFIGLRQGDFNGSIAQRICQDFKSTLLNAEIPGVDTEKGMDQVAERINELTVLITAVGGVAGASAIAINQIGEFGGELVKLGAKIQRWLIDTNTKEAKVTIPGMNEITVTQDTEAQE